MALVLDFFKRQFTHIPLPQQDFTGKTIIVTGSNTGLGLAAAEHFVRLGAEKVILAVRSIDKGNAAALKIAKATSKNVCEVWHLDMADFASIQAFVKKAEGLKRLDIVLENAGLLFSKWTEQEGMEMTIRVNVVGTFMLALGLMPVLRKSGKEYGITPVLTVVASDVHFWAAFNERKAENIFTELNTANPANVSDRYNVSKLLDVLIVRQLASLTTTGPHSSEPIIVNCVSPGLCHSELSRDQAGVLGYVFGIVKKLLARTTEVGGGTFVFSTVAGKESNGQYMSECVITEPSAFVKSKEGQQTQEKLWTELSEILEGIQPGITKNI